MSRVPDAAQIPRYIPTRRFPDSPISRCRDFQIPGSSFDTFSKPFKIDEYFPSQAPVLYGASFNAEVAELADAHGSGPCTRKGVGVRVPSSAPVFFVQ
jgi:hypothetical protein